MQDRSSLAKLHERYRRFAEYEARGVCPLYEALALAICDDPALTAFVAALPKAKQQPNLVLAAVRHLCGTPDDGRHLAALVARDHACIRALILARNTQTNEPGRCAALLPVLAVLPQPLALLEVGAAAGLCLLPDRYGYDYGHHSLAPPMAGGPVFPCRVDDATPLPSELPRVVWRAGLDLQPVDLEHPADVAWLETLVWPGQAERAARLRAAVSLAREAPPRVVRGDLRTGLRDLAAEAPADATLVIFHSAVLGYLRSRTDVDRFVATVRGLGARWVSNEVPAVLPAIAAKAPVAPPRNRFLLALDGVPLAFTGPHGQSIDWCGEG